LEDSAVNETGYKDRFGSFHPVVNLLYFIIVIGFTMFFTHPICLSSSLLCALIWSIYINGGKAVKFCLIFVLPMMLFAALLNPAFNHRGSTILTYLPSGNPLTLESILYGLAAATMLAAVILWFSCLNSVMTSDKFVYLFGRVIPALSLILSMALRFVPRFRAQIKVISNAQKCIGRDVSNGSKLQKIKNGIKILSIMVTWALENAIETADSMKNRGYGLPGRTAFSIFRFDSRDKFALAYIAVFALIVLAGAAAGAYHFRYFPDVRGEWYGFSTISVFAAYLALGLFPMIVNLKEDLIWKSIESKI
jgi:energy-coupling factor transport system permease protein